MQNRVGIKAGTTCKMSERIFGAAQVRQEGKGLFLVMESVDYHPGDGRRKPFVRTRKIILPQAFADVVAMAKEGSISLRIRFCDNGTDQMQAESVEVV